MRHLPVNRTRVDAPDDTFRYRFLTKTFSGAVKWNFGSKFLVDKNGVIAHRSKLLPLQLEPAIQSLLQQSTAMS